MQETTNTKIMTMSFVATAILVFIVVQVLFEQFAGSFALVARLHNIEIVQHGLPILSAFVTFGVLQFTPTIRTWADECIAEVRKVVWPTRQETIGMTVVCCVMVLAIGLALGVFDWGSQHLIKAFVNIGLFH